MEPNRTGSRYRRPVRSSVPVLVTGATGYVGGRLVPRLLDAGHRVRCLARSAPKLAARSWAGDPRVEIVEADVMDTGAVPQPNAAGFPWPPE